MLPCLYVYPFWVLSGNPTYFSQTISNFLIRTMFTEKVFYCVFFLPSQDALLTTCLFVSERAQYMVDYMACMVFPYSISVAPNHFRCLAGDFLLWFRSVCVLQSIEEFNWFPWQWWALVRLIPPPFNMFMLKLYYFQLSRSNRELWKKIIQKILSTDIPLKFHHKIILWNRWLVGKISI